MKKYSRLIVSLLLVMVAVLIKPVSGWISKTFGTDLSLLIDQKNNLIIASISWLIIVLIRRLKKRVLRKHDITKEDNLESRKLHTQINILEKVLIYIIVLTAIGLILLSFESIREIGVGIFASAGLAGIIIGLSAQKVVGALLAGVQIAIT